jgi:hypothetical protein
VIVLFTLAVGSGCSSGSPASDAAGRLPQTSSALSPSPSASAPAGSPPTSVAATTPATPATPTTGSKSAAAPSSKPSAKASSAPSSSSAPAAGAKPPPGSWPNAGNTGVKPGTKLVPKKGEINVNTDGAVIENIDLVGDIRIEANNVTIRNVRVTGPRGGDIDNWGILQWVGYHGLTVEDSEIAGNSDTELRTGIMDPGGVVNVRRCNIHGISKHGIDTTQGVIEDTYIHDPFWFAAADGELDSIRISGSPDSGTSLLIQHNTLIDTNTTNGAISMFETDGGQPTRVTIAGNYMATWGFCIFAGGAGAPTSYIVAKDNVFGAKFKDGYSYVTEWNPHGKGNVWSGNTWEDGRPAPLV